MPAIFGQDKAYEAGFEWAKSFPTEIDEQDACQAFDEWFKSSKYAKEDSQDLLSWLMIDFDEGIEDALMYKRMAKE